MSLYQTLGVDKDASPEDIKRAHRRRVRETHPDLHPNKRAEFEEVQKAYEVLTNPTRRMLYDALGLDGTRKPRPIRRPWSTFFNG